MYRLVLIISAIVSVFSLAGGYLFCFPKYQEFRNEKKLISQENIALKEKSEHFSKLEEVFKELDNHKDDISKIDSSLPSRVSLPILFNLIKNISERNKLVLGSISSSVSSSSKNSSAGNSETEGNKIEGVKNISISISLVGSYQDFKNFLSSIYKSARLIEVNSISFSSSSEDLFNFSLSLETHILSEAEASQKVVNSPEENVR